MEENEIKEDQIEPIIQDFAVCSLRQNTSYDTLIQIGREALYLEYIAHGKQTIDRLEDQRQEILRQMQLAREERDAKRQELDTIAAKLEKYRKEIPSIQRIIELENELEETKRMNKLYENSERVLIKERDDAWRESMKLNADVIELDAKNKNLARQLSICINELDKLSEKSTNKSITK